MTTLLASSAMWNVFSNVVIEDVKKRAGAWEDGFVPTSFLN